MDLYIESTITTPEVRLESGVLEIKGRSIPEDTFDFYIPVIEKITEYLKNPSKLTQVIIYLEYINSSSKKYLINIIQLLEKSFLQGNEMFVKWLYDEDDESIYELGNDIKSFVKIPFRMEEIM